MGTLLADAGALEAHSSRTGGSFLGTCGKDRRMTNRQERTLRMFEMVLYHVDHTKLKMPPPLLRQMRTRLEETVRRIEALRTQQRSGVLETGRPGVRELKVDIRRRRMLPLVRVMRPLLRFAPGESVVWSVPHARANAKTIGQHAVRMAKVLRPHTKLLAAAGYDRTFLKELDADGRRLMQGEIAKTKGLNKRSRATRDLAAEFKKGMENVGVIEGLLMYHESQGRNRLWRWSRRIKKRMGRPKAKRDTTASVHITRS